MKKTPRRAFVKQLFTGVSGSVLVPALASNDEALSQNPERLNTDSNSEEY